MSFRRVNSGTGRIVRTGGSISLSRPGAQISRSGSSTVALPTLYDDLEPVEMIELGHRVAATIRTDIAWTQENVGPVESGGWLLGRSRNYVIRATVPGGDSYATRSSIDLGQEQLRRAQRQHGDAILGCWHFHGLGDDRPSDTDLRAWAHGARLTGDRWIGLIAVPSQTWRPEPTISGWQTVRLPNGLMLTERLKVAA